MALVLFVDLEREDYHLLHVTLNRIIIIKHSAIVQDN